MELGLREVEDGLQKEGTVPSTFKKFRMRLGAGYLGPPSPGM